MKSKGLTKNFSDAKVDALATVVCKGEDVSDSFLKELDDLTGGQISTLEGDEFQGKEGETMLMRFKTDKGKAGRLLVIGGGEKDDYKAANVAKASGTATRLFRKLGLKSFAIAPRCDDDAVMVAANANQGFVTSQFELDKYKTIDKNVKSVDEIQVYVDGAKPADLKKGLERGQIIGDSINVTRDLANEPPNILTPAEMANRAKKMAKANDESDGGEDVTGGVSTDVPSGADGLLDDDDDEFTDVDEEQIRTRRIL